MKIELNNNKVFINRGSVKQEIHPFWLRERVDGEEFLDKRSQQRLFDPTLINSEIDIEQAKINNGFLEVKFNDGVNSKININKISLEFSNNDSIIKSIDKKSGTLSCKILKILNIKMIFLIQKKCMIY